MSETVHVPVLLHECVDSLEIKPGGTYVDGTFGGGGHSRAIAEAVGKSGTVISIDQDADAFERANSWLENYPIQPIHANFRKLPRILKELSIPAVDGILLDLGFSSDQLADEDRGFSFTSSGELDLRFDPSRGEPAWKLVNRLSARHLADIIYRNGEERFSRRIAAKIVETRRTQQIRYVHELCDLVRSVVPRSKNHSIDPATRTMQALRIEVNDELGSLDDALQQFPDLLASSGRLSIISFHSLEDRRVKNAFRDHPQLEVLTKKPILATEEELRVNSRAKSAKLRIAQKV